jgi:hypothetical protein
VNASWLELDGGTEWNARYGFLSRGVYLEHAQDGNSSALNCEGTRGLARLYVSNEDDVSFSYPNLSLGMFFHPPNFCLMSELVLEAGVLKRVRWRSGDFAEVVHFYAVRCYRQQKDRDSRRPYLILGYDCNTVWKKARKEGAEISTSPISRVKKSTYGPDCCSQYDTWRMFSCQALF